LGESYPYNKTILETFINKISQIIDMDKFKNRQIVGFVEYAEIFGNDNKKKKIKARIDTGAVKSSIDARLAAELHLGPIIKRKLVVSAHGRTLRPVMEARIKIGRRKMKSEFTIADRTHMKYKILVGQNILKEGFLVDPMKKIRR
tara:strand:+ start:1627 stop:2061 length:435 start_codon:yes stop_codon:yes gene_type:complete